MQHLTELISLLYNVTPHELANFTVNVKVLRPVNKTVIKSKEFPFNVVYD